MFRKIIKKLNNFNFTAKVMAAISSVAGFYSLASFFFYHFAGDLDKKGNNRTPGFSSEAFVKYDRLGRAIPGSNIGLYLGFILFVACLISLITSILVVYSLVPYIKNREKLLPKKSLLMTGFVGAAFQLVVIVLMVLLAAKENPHTEVGIWLTLPLGIVSFVGVCLYLVAYLKCDFYMPEIRRD